MGITYINLVLF